MSPIQNLWQSIETQYTNGTFPENKLEKIDALIYSNDIENIRNGLTLMTTITPEYLCRYLKMVGKSLVFRNASDFIEPLIAERVFIEIAKVEPIWKDLHKHGAFNAMQFRALGDVTVGGLRGRDKNLCFRMAQEMVRIPAGEFMMGALKDDEDARDDERPRHKVTLTQDLLVGKYPVTQLLWERIMGTHWNTFQGAIRPVESVKWYACIEFCNALSTKKGLEPVYTIDAADYRTVTCNWNANGFRLLTEAEWEYCAQGDKYHKYAGSNNADEVSWHEGNSQDQTHPVGQKKPNHFGLYDMSGNVSEWCWDRIDTEGFGDINGDSRYQNTHATDPSGSEIGSFRVKRGGSWYSAPTVSRVSSRSSFDPEGVLDDLGFRIARALTKN